jgi:predicted F0F1-ATPase subunit
LTEELRIIYNERCQVSIHVDEEKMVEIMDKTRNAKDISKIADKGYILEGKRKRQNSGSSKVSWYYLGAGGQIGLSIALPIAGGAILGKILDEKFAHYPTYTLTGLVIGILLSFANFWVTVKSILKKGS